MKLMLTKRVLARGLVASLAAPVLASVLVGGAALAGDAEAGKKKAETCLGCHGVSDYVNVYPTYKVPKIGGQHEGYLISALRAYKEKTRSHATMQGNASSLSDEDIADIAAYFASLK